MHADLLARLLMVPRIPSNGYIDMHALCCPVKKHNAALMRSNYPSIGFLAASNFHGLLGVAFCLLEVLGPIRLSLEIICWVKVATFEDHLAASPWLHLDTLLAVSANLAFTCFHHFALFPWVFPSLV